MSTFKVTISIEVDGPITGDGHPTALSFRHDYHTWDSPEWYAIGLRRATAEATAKVMTVMDKLAPAAPSTPDSQEGAA